MPSTSSRIPSRAGTFLRSDPVSQNEVNSQPKIEASNYGRVYSRTRSPTERSYEPTRAHAAPTPDHHCARRCHAGQAGSRACEAHYLSQRPTPASSQTSGRNRPASRETRHCSRCTGGRPCRPSLLQFGREGRHPSTRDMSAAVLPQPDVVVDVPLRVEQRTSSYCGGSLRVSGPGRPAPSGWAPRPAGSFASWALA